MSKEFGVQEAVKSFHRHLPIQKMRCDLLPKNPAIWRYELDEKHHLKLSDEAAFILMEQKQLKMKNIKV
jgi:sterol 3beta-glucosyltransferase